jgi:type VI secretion system secreted protein Hcp
MPVDAFIYFDPGSSGMAKPEGETQDSTFSAHKAFEIKSFKFDIENKTSLGSATSGAGGGKVQFNQFTIEKNTDSATPIFFKNCALGAHYKKAFLAIRKSGGDQAAAGKPYLVFTFGLVYTTKIDWGGPGDDFGPTENITFAYGALKIEYWKQAKDGKMTPVKETEWNQLTNKPTFES